MGIRLGKAGVMGLGAWSFFYLCIICRYKMPHAVILEFGATGKELENRTLNWEFWG